MLCTVSLACAHWLLGRTPCDHRHSQLLMVIAVELPHTEQYAASYSVKQTRHHLSLEQDCNCA